jgi:phosphatidylglycerophosphatase C
VVERSPLTLAPEKLVSELAAMLGDADPRSAVMAFDGDGTLWTGDVGEDLFHLATREGFLRPDALPALLNEAERHAIALEGPREANRVAGILMAAYLAGLYPERETCAMMAWCFAGRALADVEALARRALEQEDVAGRLVSELRPVLDWARSAGVRCVLISASPRAIVEPAGKLWGFAPSDVAAATPRVVNGAIAAELEFALPYAEAKLTAGKALFGSARWLATFGDNVFDIDMLKAAELGVAVRPKPKLEAELPALGLRLLAPRAV